MTGYLTPHAGLSQSVANSKEDHCRFGKSLSGPRMFFGRVVSQLMAFAAVGGVFGEIPIISDWAFWFMVGAYLLWLGVNRPSGRRFKTELMLTLLLTMVAIVGVFVEIPMVSSYAFWVMAASYVIIVSSTDIFRRR